MSKKLLSITVIAFLAMAFGMFLFIDSFDSNLVEATGMIVSTESFPVYLETHPILSSLPKSTSIGIKVGDYFYEIDGNEVHEIGELSGEEDLIISLPQGYEVIIGELGLCEAVKKAYSDKNIDVEVLTSKATLMLKYRKLLKYGECLR